MRSATVTGRSSVDEAQTGDDVQANAVATAAAAAEWPIIGLVSTKYSFLKSNVVDYCFDTERNMPQ